MEIAIYVLAAAIVVAGAFYFLARKNGNGGSAQSENMSHSIGKLAGQLGQSIDAQNKLTTMMTDRLDAIEHRVNTTLSSTAERTAEALGNISNRLETIDKAQANLTELSGQVVSLQEILSDKQTRGAFGQGQMEEIVRDQIPIGHFEFQATLSNNSRPDCLIRVASGVPSIVIDAKFPLESFEGLKSARSEPERNAAATKLRADIRRHVKAIAEKYLVPGETQSPALMFVPAESIYAELHSSFADVMQEARRMQVVIVSPHILMLAVNTLRTLLRDARVRERAVAIQKEVTLLSQDIGELAKGISKLRQHFDLSNRDIEEIQKAMDRVNGRGAKIEAAEFEDSGSPPLPDGTGSAPRQLPPNEPQA